MFDFSSLFEENIFPILLNKLNFVLLLSFSFGRLSPSIKPVPNNNNLGSSINRTSLILNLFEYISSEFESYLKKGLYIVKSL